jgi:hypothetical protein
VTLSEQRAQALLSRPTHRQVIERANKSHKPQLLRLQMSISPKDSAVARTPVEIWTETLSYLIDDPKAHPLCKLIELEDYVYPPESPNHFDKATYDTLRAVCRSWRTIVEQCAHIPQEVVIENKTPISAPLFQNASYLRISWLRLPSKFPDISTAFGAPSCKVIHMHFESCLESSLLRDIVQWLAGLPSLRALRLRCDFNMPLSEPGVLFSLLSDTCTHLTSLSIGHFMPSPKPLSLPRLKILIMYFDLRFGPLTHSFSDWNLPELKMLGLTFDNRACHRDANLKPFCPITKGIKALSLFSFTRPKNIIAYPIDLEEAFPSLEFLFLGHTPLYLSKPIPPQHPLQFIKFSTFHTFPLFSSSVLPPKEHKKHRPVQLYLVDEQLLLEDREFLDALMHAGIEARAWDGKHVTQ